MLVTAFEESLLAICYQIPGVHKGIGRKWIRTCTMKFVCLHLRWTFQFDYLNVVCNQCNGREHQGLILFQVWIHFIWHEHRKWQGYFRVSAGTCGDESTINMACPGLVCLGHVEPPPAVMWWSPRPPKRPADWIVNKISARQCLHRQKREDS